MLHRVFQTALWPVLALVFIVVPLAGAGAQTNDLSIAAFYGKWTGAGVSESEGSLYFRLSTRDLDVTIEPSGPGFEVNWTTVQRQRGAPDDPTPERKSTAIRFVPTDRAGVWRASGSSDPLVDETYAWARIRGQTLTVHTLAIGDDGGYEMQVYNRTLTPLGMTLGFVAFRDAEERRTAKGRLVKIAN